MAELLINYVEAIVGIMSVQQIAPPSTAATLLVNLSFDKLNRQWSKPSHFNKSAPPLDTDAVLFVNVESYISKM